MLRGVHVMMAVNQSQGGKQGTRGTQQGNKLIR